MALLAASTSLSSLSIRCAQAPHVAATRAPAAQAQLPGPVAEGAQHQHQQQQQWNGLTRQHVEVGGSALAGALFAALASTDSAAAAQQMLELAASDQASDSRGLALLLPLVPAVGWVLFNILQPALNQLSRMRSAKGLALTLGLGAAASSILLGGTPPAGAAQEVATLAADNDSRGLLVLFVLIPAVGWVLFNILQPALNQFNKMRSSKGFIGAVGLSAAATSALLLPPDADAAVRELASVAAADSDSRGILLLGVLIPAVGWVLFNILQPALNQLDKMRISKGVVGGALGLGAGLSALMSPAQADAAVQELASLADNNDARGILLLGVLIPAVGWVLFNILQPALNQFDKMRAQK